ncbi:alpha/beta fold hydrolase [Microbacterium sp. C7(2022)]|uniref:alpha/beta fold hydrolase n=1 Tax=Microbacterium sp. C7(2022) TaxID=2992759 RepID=UPI00237AB3F5|nr:alpha/beta hydrolase [Microbacterium sp. C7(2022)]MDE0546454.1 alpha/beta hydrolase [Microbacterium sp. C7(2022)]
MPHTMPFRGLPISQRDVEYAYGPDSELREGVTPEPARRALTVPDGTTVSYVVFPGTGPTVVILHGLAGSGREFEPTARALAGRRVILIDQRGHGHSTRNPADTSRAAFVDDVVRVIQAESAEPVDLVGQSMGAHTAMLVAASEPKLIRRLVLLECDAGSGTPEEHAALGEFFRSWKVPFVDRDAAAASLGGSPLAHAWAADLEQRPDGLYPRFDPDVMVATISAVATPRWTEWEQVTTPTLVVYAENGMFTPEQKSQFVARGAYATRVDLAGGSHDAHLDAFTEWIAALSSFLETR